MFFKFEILSDLPGRLRLKVNNYKKIPQKAADYQNYGIKVIEKLEGVKSVKFNFVIGTILIEYDKEKLTSKEIVDYLNGIRNLVSKNMDLINTLDKYSEEEASQMLFDILDQYIRERK